MTGLDFDSRRPEVRSDMLVRHYDNEIVAWSPDALAPVHLDPVAALIFQLLDGDVSMAELTDDVHAALGIPEEVARSQLRRVTALMDAGSLFTTDAGRRLSEASADYFPGPPNP